MSSTLILGVNAHVYDPTRGLLITACEDSDIMSRLDSQLSNIQLPWEDSASASVVPLGSLNCWLYEASSDSWVPTTTLFFEHQVSALAFDSKRGNIWVGLHNGQVICYRCSHDYTELEMLYDCTLHNHRVGAMYYSAEDDIVISVGRDSVIHVIHHGDDNAGEQGPTATDANASQTREHIYLTSHDAEEGWLGSIAYDTTHKLIYVGSFSGKVLVYHISQRSGPYTGPIYYLTNPAAHNSYNNGSLFSPKQQDLSGIPKTNSPIPLSRHSLVLNHMILGHTDCVRAMHLCPTTSYLATAGFDYKTGDWCLVLEGQR